MYNHLDIRWLVVLRTAKPSVSRCTASLEQMGHWGPMWSVVAVSQDGSVSESLRSSRKPLDVSCLYILSHPSYCSTVRKLLGWYIFNIHVHVECEMNRITI